MLSWVLLEYSSSALCTPSNMGPLNLVVEAICVRLLWEGAGQYGPVLGHMARDSHGGRRMLTVSASATALLRPFGSTGVRHSISHAVRAVRDKMTFCSCASADYNPLCLLMLYCFIIGAEAPWSKTCTYCPWDIPGCHMITAINCLSTISS